MHTFLIAAVTVEAIVVVVAVIAWVRARNARSLADACNFPGCIRAREELRQLADRHEAIPRQDVVDVVDAVERSERP